MAILCAELFVCESGKVKEREREKDKVRDRRVRKREKGEEINCEYEVHALGRREIN